MRAWICIATYNERANIGPLIDQVLAQLPDAAMVVVDDNSPDGTGALLDEMAAGDSRLRVIHRAGKLGYASAHIQAMRYALGEGAELVVTMDADFSHDPKYLPDLMGLIDQGADLAVGSRYVAGGGTENWPWYRKLLSGTANALAKASLGLELHDCTGGYRAYRASLLRRLRLGNFRSEGYSFLEETLLACSLVGARMAEVPIVFAERRAGRSKISRKVILEAAIMLARLAWKRRFAAQALRRALTEA